MLPGLGLILGYSDERATEQHLYAAAAMAVNLIVAITATRQHLKKGAVRRELVRVLIPTLGVALVGGVLLSNWLEGRALALGLAVFIALWSVANLAQALRDGPGHEGRPKASDAPAARSPNSARIAGVGLVAGSAGGLLGLGGGAIMVPGLQAIARVPLRQAIAASAAAMCATTGIGAALKIGTLSQHGLRWTDALLLAGAMGLPAMLLAPQGAKLAHGLPIRWVRASVAVILLASAARLSGAV